jgi:hypothetical protein
MLHKGSRRHLSDRISKQIQGFSNPARRDWTRCHILLGPLPKVLPVLENVGYLLSAILLQYGFNSPLHLYTGILNWVSSLLNRMSLSSSEPERHSWPPAGWPHPGGLPPGNPSESEGDNGPAMSVPRYLPNCSDALQVRSLLLNAVHRSSPTRGLPKEIVDMIMDSAEYWPSMESALGRHITIGQDEDTECLRTPPLCYDVSMLFL